MFGQIDIDMLHGFQSMNPLLVKIGQLPVTGQYYFFYKKWIEIGKKSIYIPFSMLQPVSAEDFQ